MLRQGFGADKSLYLLLILGTLGISTATHIGMGKLPLPSHLLADNDDKVQELEVEWEFTPKEPQQPEPAPEPEPPPLPKFVETNPDVPENEPDETINESNRNQQAAQEEPDPTLPTDNAPTIEGEETVSQKIIQGQFQLQPPQPPPPGLFTLPNPNQPNQPKEETAEGKDPKKVAAPPPPPPSPLTIEEGEGEGVATKEQKEFPQAQPNTQKVIPLSLPTNPDPNATAQKEQIPQRAQPQTQPQPLRPLPRPKLPASVVPGPLKNNPNSAPRKGRVAIDAKWSEYGEYSQRMVAAISLQWNKLVYNANLQSLPVSKVHVRFILNKFGQIESIEVKDNTAGQLPAFFCTDAIESRAPFGPWTEAMITTFGDQTDVNIHFHYR